MIEKKNQKYRTYDEKYRNIKFKNSFLNIFAIIFLHTTSLRIQLTGLRLKIQIVFVFLIKLVRDWRNLGKNLLMHNKSVMKQS